jgi:DNA repair and recombination protein RAD52
LVCNLFVSEGFNGWSSSIVEMTNDFLDESAGKFSCGVSAIVRITLKDGSFHEDIGYGCSENQRQKGAALEQAKKTAVSDGIKRAIRNFGNVLGLTVYDRDFIK